ncbi:Uma2 family endonuclease [Streptomyces tubercidicus]|uniref:Uma2 family endonuclease n=1 Tax=Streptomyces tubercidicus TaxID=47759 RepID=UPI002E1128BF|nr:Uma2 family endonuclease [Streptomyces tubercidicus]WSX22539.1 Uma2 family endonuclease [Streptomyces tubercidicus]
MIALAAEHFPQEGRVQDALVRIREDTEAPEGCMVEIVDGVVTVAPPRGITQNVIVCKLQRSLYCAMPDDWGAYQKLGLALPAGHGISVPHLVVAPEAALSANRHVTPASAAELVVEIASVASAVHARVQKPAGYACAGVPFYLLVDQWARGGPAVTLYGEPEGHTYRTLSAVKFGEPIQLPAPFEVAVDTALFPEG